MAHCIVSLKTQEPPRILQNIHQRDFHTHYKNSATWKTRNADDRNTVYSKCSQHAAFISGYFSGGQYSQVPQTLLGAEWLSHEQVCVTPSACSVRSKCSQATGVSVICCSLWCTTVVLSDCEENLFHKQPRIWKYSHLNLVLTYAYPSCFHVWIFCLFDLPVFSFLPCFL